jgi:hypothetical protein
MCAVEDELLLSSFAKRFERSEMSREEIKQWFDLYRKLGAFDYQRDEHGSWKVILKPLALRH